MLIYIVTKAVLKIVYLGRHLRSYLAYDYSATVLWRFMISFV